MKCLVFPIFDTEIIVSFELEEEACSCISCDMYGLSTLLMGECGNKNGPVGRSSTVGIDGKIDCMERLRHRSLSRISS